MSLTKKKTHLSVCLYVFPLYRKIVASSGAAGDFLLSSLSFFFQHCTHY